MKRIFIYSIILFPGLVFAQRTAGGGTFGGGVGGVGAGLSESASNPTVMQVRPYGMISEMDLDEVDKENKDPFLLVEDWSEGEIVLLNNSRIGDEPFKYDVRYNVFEFNRATDQRFLSGRKVREFILADGEGQRNFYNALYIKGFNFIGFVELLHKGEQYDLYEYHTMEIQTANYIPALDAGDKRDKLIRKSEFYLFADEKGSLIINNKKKFLELFPEDQAKAKGILKENKLKVSRKEDLVIFFQEMNKS